MFPIHPKGDETHSGSRPLSFAPKHVVIAAGGVESDPAGLNEHLGDFSYLIAADGGLRLTQEMGLTCDLLVGDFDTLQEKEVEAAEMSGTEIRQFPSDKAKSDLEIAIDVAVERGASYITLIGALGGEVDHCLTNFLSPLSHCSENGVWARLLTSTSQVYLANSTVEVLAPEQRISLVSLSPETNSLTLTGFQYALEEATLSRSRTLGLANKTLSKLATIEFEEGELFITLTHSEKD